MITPITNVLRHEHDLVETYPPCLSLMESQPLRSRHGKEYEINVVLLDMMTCGAIVTETWGTSACYDLPLRWFRVGLFSKFLSLCFTLSCHPSATIAASDASTRMSDLS